MRLHNIPALLAAPLLLAGFASCDTVDENDRIIPVEKIESQRVVLVQEFSGQNCRNCPGGADAIHDILSVYPENVVAVGMHPSGTPNSGPMFGTNTTSEIATEMYDFYGRPAEFPCAIINGTEFSINPSKWFELTLSQMVLAPEITLTVEAAASGQGEEKKIEAKYSVEYNERIFDNLNIVVWLTESNVVAAQNVYGDRVRDYVHNHLLRASFCENVEGVNLGDSFKIGETSEGSLTLTPDKAWNLENCEVIAYVYRTSDHYVPQAAKCHIKIN
ncbi:MAG: Omp28-related outer membrane protein [Muribaculaceae bacterium]|nr:Omp28-related outer membrane protein [Muribaculaceae bacterium]